MLKDILGSLFESLGRRFIGKGRAGHLRKEADAAMAAGGIRQAVELYEEYLKLVPDDTDALVSFGLCLSDIGEKDRANDAFELAYRLDDSNMSAVINHARYLVEKRRLAEALPHLIFAQTAIGDSPHVYTIYAAIQLLVGDAEASKAYALRSWLSNFDNARLADAHLFGSCYCDLAEETIAAEHDFWAQTLVPLPYKLRELVPETAPKAKLRIGYWSPDIRDHSVRYFFRPLLEGHDRDRVELIVYHDGSAVDAQTEQARLHCDAFHQVHTKKDEELYHFILSHQLDVLVELAGHTSANRLPMLQARMARMQVTAIGYPFSTGMRTIDAKVLDGYLLPPGNGAYYAEEPLVLPGAFWCFDPMMEVPAAEEPPVIKNGYVTFGCFGNVGKINDRILQCWMEILRRVPRSRLVLQSINFEDAVALKTMGDKLRDAGFSSNRYELVPPTAGLDFYASYNGIDIILDTYPFNGGTTTAFAVYMGVPVVSWRGNSILSRMGYSILANLDAGDLVVDDAEQYVHRVIALSQDVPYLKRFRREARTRMTRCSLGNGKMFARDFEDACEKYLANPQRGADRYQPAVAVLPPEELIRRAYTVLGFGQTAAAARIVGYCLRHYPYFAGARILETERLTQEGQFQEAADELMRDLDRYDAPGRTAVLINVFRYFILAGDRNAAADILRQLEADQAVEPNEQMQFRMFRSQVDAGQVPNPMMKEEAPPSAWCRSVQVVLPCDDMETYETIVEQMRQNCTIPVGMMVNYVRCSEAGLLRAYRSALGDPAVDMVVLLQRNTMVYGAGFFLSVVDALAEADIVGCSGATRWERLDWERDDFGVKALGYVAPSGEKSGFWEAHVVGEGLEAIRGGMRVLAAEVLAIRRGRACTVDFDEDLVGGNGLLEQMWTHEAFLAGCRLAVHRNLGVLIGRLSMDGKYLANVRLQVANRMKFDAMALLPRDGMSISTPCATREEALSVLEHYLVPARSPAAEPA